MKFYVQTDEVNRITDVITYPHEGYVEIEANLPLPTGVLGGAYELRDGMILYRSEWDTNETVNALRNDVDMLLMAQLEQEGIL